MTLPNVTKPEELAFMLGWSERRVRDVAKRAGACRIMGNRIVFLDEDVAVMESIANGEFRLPRDDNKAIKRGGRSCHVYFFKQEHFVKIGWSNKWRKRLMAIQANTPFEIEVLAVYRGSSRMERELHQQFSEHRVRLEWFRYCDEIASFIEENKQKCLKDARNSLLQLVVQ